MNSLKFQKKSSKELGAIKPRMNFRFRLMHGLLRCAPVKSKFQMDFIHFKKPIFPGRHEENHPAQDLVLRRATEEDLEQIIHHPECRLPETYYNRLADEHGVFCAVKGSEVISFVWFNFEVMCSTYGSEHQIVMKKTEKETCYLYDLYTCRKFRNRGIASALLDFVEAYLGNSGVSFLTVCVSPSNTPSVMLFSRKDYVPVNILHVYRMMRIKKCFQGTKRELQTVRRWIG